MERGREMESDESAQPHPMRLRPLIRLPLPSHTMSFSHSDEDEPETEEVDAPIHVIMQQLPIRQQYAAGELAGATRAGLAIANTLGGTEKIRRILEKYEEPRGILEGQLHLPEAMSLLDQQIARLRSKDAALLGRVIQYETYGDRTLSVSRGILVLRLLEWALVRRAWLHRLAHDLRALIKANDAGVPRYLQVVLEVNFIPMLFSLYSIPTLVKTRTTGRVHPVTYASLDMVFPATPDAYVTSLTTILGIVSSSFDMTMAVVRTSTAELPSGTQALSVVPVLYMLAALMDVSEAVLPLMQFIDSTWRTAMRTRLSPVMTATQDRQLDLLVSTRESIERKLDNARNAVRSRFATWKQIMDQTLALLGAENAPGTEINARILQWYARIKALFDQNIDDPRPTAQATEIITRVDWQHTYRRQLVPDRPHNYLALIRDLTQPATADNTFAVAVDQQWSTMAAIEPLTARPQKRPAEEPPTSGAERPPKRVRMSSCANCGRTGPFDESSEHQPFTSPIPGATDMAGDDDITTHTFKFITLNNRDHVVNLCHDPRCFHLMRLTLAEL